MAGAGRPDPDLPEADAAPTLSVRGLSTEFRAGGRVRRVVDDVSFDVKRREILAFVGESGSGKSVTFLSVLRLIADPPGRIVDGSVLFDGEDLMTLDPKGARMRSIRGGGIGFVFQEPMTSLNPVLTIGRQIMESLRLHLDMGRREARARAAGLLSAVGIGDAERRLGAYPHEFSGGMRQRIMIAIAVACSPRLIIADEPTTALDVTTQAQILELLAGTVRDLGASLVLITHNLGIVARYADRINVMYAGRIVESGATDDVFADPRHPYTRALLDCVPRLGETRKLAPIAGQPPDAGTAFAHCPFLPRCARALPVCRTAPPPRLADVAPNHSAACHAAELPE